MKLPQEFDEHPKMSMTVMRMIIGVTSFMVIILVLVLIINQDKNKKPAEQALLPPETALAPSPAPYPEAEREELTPDDFDFWDMYPEESPSATPEETVAEEEKEDPSTDGRHTLVVHADGEEEWVLISPYLPKHDYDYTKLVMQSDLMSYYVDGRLTSYVGVDVSKYQDYIDFVKVKKAGIDFVMIRVGARGYSSGQIAMDDYFLENIKRATDAGLEIGLYFCSQAITEEEAEEEAQLVLSSIGDYEVRYPIAFDMESVPNDTARTDTLSREEKTKIAKAFLDAVADAGYNPMLYGNKEWLIKKVDLSKLTDYDIWLSQPGDLPDYPYKFSMWQYSTTASVDGIAGYANLNISFIDYSEK